MKIVSMSLCLMICALYVNAQKNKGNNLYINSDNHSNALIYFNGSIFKKNLYDINPDTIGIAFAEGDSSYVRRSYGTNPDTSLIYHYFGKLRNRGILFIYTKNKVKTITEKQFQLYLENHKHRALFKINNEPLTDNYHKVAPDKIQILTDFTLKHWDTGVIDTFTLFIIKTKK